ncbi:MAG TPA: lipocalin family protein [Hyphomicrobiales bacterium]|nr:lipocalin family protein [Hyphomicrobiales bacterium]
MARLVRKLGVLLIAGGVGAAAAIALRRERQPVRNPRVPEPAKPVDLDRYLGLWHELGRFETGFERGCEGVTAEYAAARGGLIRVVNTCRERPRADASHVARGRAKVADPATNAKLKVSFFGPFFLGNYWVLDHADDYAWSIVGEPSGRYLWILSRDPTPGEEAYRQLVTRAEALGYDMTDFRRTRQAPA